jgi:hypothetical protein
MYYTFHSRILYLLLTGFIGGILIYLFFLCAVAIKLNKSVEFMQNTSREYTKANEKS